MQRALFTRHHLRSDHGRRNEMHTLSGTTAVDAWVAGARLLRANGGEAFNVITTIEQPCVLHAAWLNTYSPQSIHGASDRIADVIGTIFPYEFVQRFSDHASMRAAYLTRHRRAMRWVRNRSRWGT